MVRKVIPEIKQRFAVGSEETGDLTFTGLQVTQQKGLMIHQRDYANEMKEVTVPVKPKGEKLSETQVTDVRRVIGQLQWLAIQTRPDLSFSASVIASSLKDLKDGELKNVNKTVKYAKYHSAQGIPYRKLDMTDEATEMWSYSDASFANLSGGGTQAAVIVFVVESKDVFADTDECCNQRGRATGVYGYTEEEKENRKEELCSEDKKKSRPKFSFEAVSKREKRWFRAHLIHWRSFRLRRVTRSTFGSETLAMVESMDVSLVLREVLSHILGRRMRIRLFTDCKSLVDALETTTMPLEKRLQVDLAALRETVRERDIESVGWVEASRNYADCLTKVMDQVALRDFLSKGELFDPRALIASVDGIKFERETEKRRKLGDFA